MSKWAHLSDEDIHPPSGRTMGAKRRAYTKYNQKRQATNYHKKYYLENKQRWKKYSYEKYGITEDDYNQMLKEQNHGCASCGQSCPSKKDLAIDHDHETGRVRGLLCMKCNTALGLLNDDPATIENLLRYANSNS